MGAVTCQLPAGLRGNDGWPWQRPSGRNISRRRVKRPPVQDYWVWSSLPTYPKRGPHTARSGSSPRRTCPRTTWTTRTWLTYPNRPPGGVVFRSPPNIVGMFSLARSVSVTLSRIMSCLFRSIDVAWWILMTRRADPSTVSEAPFHFCVFHSQVVSILPRLTICFLTIYFIDYLCNYLV
jgi:hypothetical protein